MGTKDSPTRMKRDSQWQPAAFKGDDLCFPVEMFVHIMEATNSSLNDSAMAKRVLANISDDATPPAAWKRKVSSQELGWAELRPLLVAEFSSKSPYTLKEKVSLLQSLCKWPREDLTSYLVRVKCVASLLVGNGRIPACSTDLPGAEDVLVRVLFLFGLDEVEQNLVVEEADIKSLEELCHILSMPEVKMISADAIREDGVQRQSKRKRKRVKEEESEPSLVIPPEVKIEQSGDVCDSSDDANSSDSCSEKKSADRIRSWPCAFCDSGPFKSKPQLWRHQEDSHQGFHYQCSECGERVRDYKSLRRHKVKSHTVKAVGRKKANARADVTDQIYDQIEMQSKDKTDDKHKFEIKDYIQVNRFSFVHACLVTFHFNYDTMTQVDG